MKFNKSNFPEHNAINTELNRLLNYANKRKLTERVNLEKFLNRLRAANNLINMKVNKLRTSNNVATREQGQRINVMKNTWSREIKSKLNEIGRIVSQQLHEKSPTYEAHLHLFYGLGCTVDFGKKNIIERSIRSINPKVRIFEHCNPSLGKTLKHLGLQCISPFSPRLSSYLKIKLAHVQASLLNDSIKRVYLVGHSYGGQTVNMICRALNKHPMASKLDVTTFGATYIAPPSELTNIKIKQFMSADDVALHCMRTLVPPVRTLMTKKSAPNTNPLFDPNKQVNNRSKGIIWLKPATGYRALIPTVVGTASEWRVHVNYNIMGYIKKHVANESRPRANENTSVITTPVTNYFTTDNRMLQLVTQINNPNFRAKYTPNQLNSLARHIKTSGQFYLNNIRRAANKGYIHPNALRRYGHPYFRTIPNFNKYYNNLKKSQ
jgi:hypothetical protein